MYLNSSNMVYLILKIFKIRALNRAYSKQKACRPHEVSYGSFTSVQIFSVLNQQSVLLRPPTFIIAHISVSFT